MCRALRIHTEGLVELHALLRHRYAAPPCGYQRIGSPWWGRVPQVHRACLQHACLPNAGANAGAFNGTDGHTDCGAHSFSHGSTYNRAHGDAYECTDGHAHGCADGGAHAGPNARAG